MPVTLFAFLIPYAVACLIPALIAALAAWQDWHELHIANRHSLVLLILFPVLAALSPALYGVPNALTGLLVLVIGMLLYGARVWGAGDAKLAAALSLYLGWSGLPFFLLGTAITGGVLAIVALAVRRRFFQLDGEDAPRHWLDRVRRGGADIPYGVAMLVPTWFLLTQQLLAAYDRFTTY